MHRSRRALAAVLAASLLALGLAVAQAPVVAAAPTSSGCPGRQTLDNRAASPLVAASYAVDGSDVTYSFDSLVDRHPTDGTPGLIAYCVYPSGSTAPDTVTATASADGADWQASPAAIEFNFSRPNGNPTNIPLDGSLDVQVGTASWTSDAPADQTVVLHIFDADECARLYGGSSQTCFVLPTPPVPPTTSTTTTTEPEPPTTSTTTTTTVPVAAPPVVTITRLGAPPRANDPDSGTYDRTWDWSVSKSVDKELAAIAGDGTATFSYTVTVHHDGGTVSNVHVDGTEELVNPNSEALQLDSLDVVLTDGTVCDVVDEPTSLTPGTSVVEFDCDLPALPAVEVSATTTLTWPAQSVDGADLAAGSTSDSEGPIGFTPDEVHGCVAVDDSLAGPLDGSLCATSSESDTEYTYDLDFSGDDAGTCTEHANTATFAATDDAEVTGSDDQTVTVCVGAAPVVTNTARTDFLRTYGWAVRKGVDRTLVEQPGGSATFNYQVAAEQTGLTDSGWTATGTATISNPNDWQTVTVDVTQTVDNGGVCTVGGSSTVTVDAEDSVDVDYTCTYSAAPSPTVGSSTTTATWDPAAASTSGSEATATSTVDFTSPTSTVDSTVLVTDTFDGAAPVVLDTLTAKDSAPYASGTYSYPRTVTVPSTNCRSYTNTAALFGPGLSANQTVKACGPAATGALTIGFWQNKNGQGVITGGSSTSGVCSSGRWLRQFAPFADLSATASCAAVGSYATSVIKAANASGASMNAMLKAQMLATSLDVYFSDPTLGGNRIAAPAAVGPVQVDLTNICAVKLTGGCVSAGTSSASVFNSQTRMSVSAMLSWAASQSNTGGTSWYGNVKSTQEKAKNAFDAINNALVYAP